MADTVLLTGATGQVGGALLPALLADPDQRVIAVVRARDEAHLALRLAALREPLGEAAGRLDAVRGDVTLPDLGLAPADLDRVRSEATSVLHGAAAVRFDQDEADAVAQNVGGTLNALALARSLHEAGRLRRLDFVGTAYVAGDRRGPVFEHECDVGQGFRNSYERSKCRAEMIVRDAGRSLPVAIHRPAIVVGDSRTGVTRAFNVLYWPLKIYARGGWRTFPGSPDVTVDVVPVDWVASAITRLRRDAGTVGGCFHLAAGDAAPTVEAIVERVRAVTGGPPLRYVDPDLYRTTLRPLLLGPLRLTERGRRIARGGKVFLPYFAGNPRFDTRATHAALGEGPPAVMAWFDTVLRYALARDFGGRADDEAPPG